MDVEEFCEIWWKEHPDLAKVEMAKDGQFDELPYWEYAEHEEILSDL